MELMASTSGRELDLLISKHVLGYGLTQASDGTHYLEGAPGGMRPVRPYSTDIGAAWEVVEKLGMTVIPIEGGSWFTLVGKAEGWKSPADFIQYLQGGNFAQAGAAVAGSAPLAICLAALKALENRAALQAVSAELSNTH
jgi:hypothetical protein